MKLSLKLTFKFLIQAPLQSLLIIFTMLAGIASLLFMTTLFTSLDNTLENAVSNSLYHVLVNRPIGDTSPFRYNEDHLNWVLSNEEVKSAVYVVTHEQSFIYNDQEIFLGLTLGSSEEIFNYYEATKIVKGRLPKENEIIIPEAVRKQYNIELPAKISYKISANNVQEITISGSYQADGRFLRYTNALGTFKSVKNTGLTKFPFRALYIKLNDTQDLDAYLVKHNNYFKGFPVNSKSLDDISPTYVIIKKTQYIVLVTIELFIALAIFMISSSVISYSINQKRRQIGVLKALGYQKKYIRRTFVIQSYLLGTIASILGYLLTKGGLRFFRYIMRDPQGNPRLTIVVNETLYVISFLVVFLTIMFATLNSLRKANLNSTTELLKE